MNNPFAQMINNFQRQQNNVNRNRVQRQQLAAQAEWDMRMAQIQHLNAVQPGWRNANPHGEMAQWALNPPPRPGISYVNVQEILRVAGAPNIGVRRLNLQKQFPDGDPLQYEPFVNGELLVVIKGNFNYVYKPESLQNWFNQRRVINPLSGEPITQNDILLFTYQEDLTLGGRRKGKKSRKNKKSRKSRKMMLY